MILAVSGWRAWIHRGFIHHHLLEMRERGFNRFRVGDAQGADELTWQMLGSSFLLRDQISRDRFYAPWQRPDGTRDRTAGARRNYAMLTGDFTFCRPPHHHTYEAQQGLHADALLCFPQPGKRRPGSGTWLCHDQAWDLGITVIIPGQKGLS